MKYFNLSLTQTKMKNIAFTLLTLSLVFSCKKDPEIPYCELHPDDCVDVRMVKDWFYFDYGSWWVYEEENSGMRDSVYVIQTYSDTGSFMFETQVHSTYDGYNYPYWANSATSDADDNIVRKAERSTSVKRAKTKPGDFVGESRCFVFYPIEGYSKYNLNSGSDFTENRLYIDSTFFQKNVADFSFDSVVKVKEDHTFIEEEQPTAHYYASGIGLIRKELIDSNQVWNLVNYSVSQINK